MLDKVAILERENAELRERLAYLERCLMGESEVSYALFGLTAGEERIFAALMTREVLSKEQLLTLAYSARLDSDLPELKIVDVFVCKIRKKLKAFGFDIRTLWGRGYAIDPAIKGRVRALIAQVGGGTAEMAA